MTDISEFTSVFRARVNLNDRRKANKRNRQALSCLACRSRKLKCDRQQPCTACNKRGEGSACTFTATNTAGNNGSSGLPNGISKTTVSAETKRSEAQAKLQKLEEIVQQLIQSGAVVPKSVGNTQNTTASSRKNSKASKESVRRLPEPDGDEELPSSQEGSTPESDYVPSALMCYNEASGGYVGATHWAALLEHINCVKEALDSSPETEFTPSELSESDESFQADDAIFIFSSGGLKVEDAIAALPPRHIADRLLAIYYGVKFSNALFIHTNKFRREYEKFWKDPSSVSMIWISVLFSILCLGSIIAARGSKFIASENYNIEPIKLCSKARQCLAAGKHTKAQPYVIEAIIAYAYCKYQLNVEADSTLWALSGYVTRLAQRLGYHRDPKHLGKHFTPFEAEMRRRTWFWVSTFDLIFSFQYGMPGIIQDDQCDTEPPSNYADEDFDEDTVIMPPPRPQTEFTNMLYYCHKIRMTGAFRRVVQQALALKQPEYEQVLKLDKELDDVHKELPSMLRMPGLIRDCSFADPSHIILHRIVLELTYHKCVCVLHRMYMTYDKENPKYEYSRTRARDSALRILDLQSDAYDETKPGGRLWDERWMVSSLTLHDFLLASMIMCLGLSQKKDEEYQQCKRCLIALQKSYAIWSEKKHSSREALHASNVLAAMLAKATRAVPELAVSMRREPTPIPQAPNQSSFNFFGNRPLTVDNGTITRPNPVFTMNTLGLNGTIGNGFGHIPMADGTGLVSTSNPINNNTVGISGGTERDRSELPGEFMPRQLTAREEAFGLGFGNDVYPMVDSFEPLDFDTLMGDSGSIDWGLVDRYLFDKTANTETEISPNVDPKIPNLTPGESTSNGSNMFSSSSTSSSGSSGVGIQQFS